MKFKSLKKRRLCLDTRNLLKQSFLQWHIHSKQRRIECSKEVMLQKDQGQKVYGILAKKGSLQLKYAFDSIRHHSRKKVLLFKVLSKLRKQLYINMQRGWESWKNYANAGKRALDSNIIFGLVSLERVNKQWAFLMLKQAADQRLFQTKDVLLQIQNATKGKLSLAFLRWKQLLNTQWRQVQSFAITNLFEILSEHLKRCLALPLDRTSSLLTRKKALM